MLFSDTEIASYISENFEPAWQSLRPVPKVTIDFGNGNVVNRTLNGNIATYVCTTDGAVVDILPGVYQPEPYLKALKDLQARARSLPQEKIRRITNLVKYHKQAAIAGPMSDFCAKVRHVTPSESTEHGSDAGLTAQLLAADTTYNESERRTLIHRKLAELPAVHPDGVHRWLYKEVLHADLDDPYLGLSPVLFGKYPFSEPAAEPTSASRVRVGNHL